MSLHVVIASLDGRFLGSVLVSLMSLMSAILSFVVISLTDTQRYMTSLWPIRAQQVYGAIRLRKFRAQIKSTALPMSIIVIVVVVVVVVVVGCCCFVVAVTDRLLSNITLSPSNILRLNVPFYRTADVSK